jgi:hypothetical protein
MAREVVRKIRADKPIFEDPPEMPKGNTPGRKNPYKEKVLAAKDYPGKWIRITVEPLQSRGSADGVRRGLTGYGKRYSWIDENDDYDAEIRRIGPMDDATYHLYVRYNGKR